MDIGMIHFALGHFPIALLIMGSGLLLAALALDHTPTRSAALVMLTCGAISSIPTVAAGLWIAAEHEAEHGETLATHRLLGIATAVVAVLGVLSHLTKERIPNADLTRNVFFIAAAVLAGSTGFVGGEMSHGHESDLAGQHVHGGAHHSSTEEATKRCQNASTKLGRLARAGGSACPEPARGVTIRAETRAHDHDHNAQEPNEEDPADEAHTH